MKDITFSGMVRGVDVTNIQEWVDNAFLRQNYHYEFYYTDDLVRVLRILIDGNRLNDVKVIVGKYIEYHTSSYAKKRTYFNKDGIEKLLELVPDLVLRSYFFDAIVETSGDKGMLSYFVHSDKSEEFFLREMSKLQSLRYYHGLFDEKYNVNKNIIKKLPPVAKLKAVERLISMAQGKSCFKGYTQDDIQDILFESGFHSKYQSRVACVKDSLLFVNLINNDTMFDIEIVYKCNSCDSCIVKRATNVKLCMSGMGHLGRPRLSSSSDCYDWAWRRWPSIENIYPGAKICSDIIQGSCKNDSLQRCSKVITGISSGCDPCRGWVLDKRVAF